VLGFAAGAAAGFGAPFVDRGVFATGLETVPVVVGETVEVGMGACVLATDLVTAGEATLGASGATGAATVDMFMTTWKNVERDGADGLRL
jgi:hypothetical protein